MSLKFPRLPINWKDQPQLFERYWDGFLTSLEKNIDTVNGISLDLTSIHTSIASLNSSVSSLTIAVASLTSRVTTLESVTAVLTNSEAAGLVFASPATTTGAPAFRAIVPTDVPTLNQNTTGNAATATALQTPRNINGVAFNGTGDITITADTPNSLTAGSGLSGSAFNGSSALTWSLAAAYGDTINPYSSKSANFVLASPNGSSGVPSFRAVVAADIPTLNQNTTGSAATLTTPRAIYGNNFDGSAALTQVIASTYGGTGNGFTKFSGPGTSEKTFTLPNASATILTDNAVVTNAQGGTGTGTAFTAGSVVYAGTSGVYSQDNSNLFWDATNKRLGISVTPAYKIDISGSGDMLRAISSTTSSGILLGDSVGTIRVGSRSGTFIVDVGSERLRVDTSGNLQMGGTNTVIDSNRIFRLAQYTVSTLPAGTTGMMAYVTDATSPTFLGTLTGGGSTKTPVFYNGTAWVAC